MLQGQMLRIMLPDNMCGGVGSPSTSTNKKGNAHLMPKQVRQPSVQNWNVPTLFAPAKQCFMGKFT